MILTPVQKFFNNPRFAERKSSFELSIHLLWKAPSKPTKDPVRTYKIKLGALSKCGSNVKCCPSQFKQKLSAHSRVLKNPIASAVSILTAPDIDRSRSSRKPALGGSLFSSSSVPPELKPVEPLATAVQKADIAAKPAIAVANQDYEKLTNPNAAIPTPPMHAAGLAALVKKLAVAESAVADSIKARRELVSGLEKLLETNRSKLDEEEAQLVDLTTRKDAIESRKHEVEDAILKGLSAAETNKISAAPLPGVASASHERPDVEELTPPPMESFTPVGSPRPDIPDVPDDVYKAPATDPQEPVAAPAPPGASAVSTPATAIGAPNTILGADLLHSLAHARPADETGAYGPSTYKKRKMSRSAAEDEFAAFAGDTAMNGIDSELGGLI